MEATMARAIYKQMEIDKAYTTRELSRLIGDDYYTYIPVNQHPGQPDGYPVSKGISAGHSQNSYRGLVRMLPGAAGARNFSQCDSLLIGSLCGAHTFPDVRSDNATAVVEHEATTSKINEDQLFYCNQRGIGPEDAVGLIVNGYAREVLSKLPMEFAVEAQKLLQVSLEGSVG